MGQRETLIRVQRQLMSDWSEENWCAGWMYGLEEELWHGSNGRLRLFDQEIADIHEIARLSGVWCDLEREVPIAEWEAIHGAPLTRMTANPPTPEQRAVMEVETAEHNQWLSRRFAEPASGDPEP